MKIFCSLFRCIFLLSFLIFGSSISRSTYDWPIHDPFTIVDTISTLQFYGPKPGFHHGIDMHAPAGTPVYAQVSGVVGMGYYYPPAQTPYTYEITIDGDDGYHWEFHHIDQDSIPKEIADLANRHGRVSAGTLLAKIYDATLFDPRLIPHLHMDLIAPDGVYQNSAKLFPKILDHSKPAVRGVYLVDSNNRVVSKERSTGEQVRPFPIGKYELVLDIIDIIDGAPMGDSLQGLTVFVNREKIGSFDFSARLPKKNYLEGVRDIFKIEPITLINNQTLTHQVDLSAPRKFLYRFDVEISKIEPGASGELVIEILAEDFSGNQTRKTETLVQFY